MTGRRLEASTRVFASRLDKVVTAAIDTDTVFEASPIGGGRWSEVTALREGIEVDGFPLVRRDEDPDAAALLLRVRYMVELARGGDSLRIVSSTVGLWVDVTGGRKRHRPLIRVEFDRYRLAKRHAAAHVHLHANSPEVAWIYGSGGRPAPDLHALHFPVGGRRFRPTLEDFLLFLDREKLYTGFKPGWKPVVLRSLRSWEDRQAASTVMNYPEVAVRALESSGYTVRPPEEGTT